jgi:hypothetical protein
MKRFPIYGTLAAVLTYCNRFSESFVIETGAPVASSSLKVFGIRLCTVVLLIALWRISTSKLTLREIRAKTVLGTCFWALPLCVQFWRNADVEQGGQIIRTLYGMGGPGGSIYLLLAATTFYVLGMALNASAEGNTPDSRSPIKTHGPAADAAV